MNLPSLLKDSTICGFAKHIQTQSQQKRLAFVPA
jgi:hypothetical protein